MNYSLSQKSTSYVGFTVLCEDMIEGFPLTMYNSTLLAELKILHNTFQLIFLLLKYDYTFQLDPLTFHFFLFLGLTHIIETRKVLDLKINLKPSYLIVPHTGFYHKKSNLLILDFGTFQVGTQLFLSAHFCLAQYLAT